MDSRTYWNHVYETKGPEQVSWFQREARLSGDLIRRFAPDRRARILDVGAGASVLADGLLDDGYRSITVVDIAQAALDVARHRLGDRARQITWVTGDLLTVALTSSAFDVWHDRAVFHFLTDPADRARYVGQVRRAVRPGGLVLVATFAEDGPARCSGLTVCRYSPTTLHAEFGLDFRPLESQREIHRTPSGAQQAFTYCACRFVPRVHTVAA